MRAALHPGGERERDISEREREDRLIIIVKKDIMSVIKRKVGLVRISSAKQKLIRRDFKFCKNIPGICVNDRNFNLYVIKL
jgi:hypothetical protein